MRIFRYIQILFRGLRWSVGLPLLCLFLWGCTGVDSEPVVDMMLLGDGMVSPMDASGQSDSAVAQDSTISADVRAEPDARPGDAALSLDGGVDGSVGGVLYRPDDGPSHEGGTVRPVDTVDALLDAIANALAGEVITIAPGSYNLNQLIRVRADGEDDARIFLRAEELGTVRLNLSHIENFKISGKFWIIENIVFSGDCADGRSCEHAFHLVGDADDVIFRNNEVVNFASHVKLNGEVVGAGPGKAFPDRVQFIRNFWHNTKYVPNNAPHNILNLDGGRDHVVRGNIFADFNTPESLPKSASAVYPKASARGILIEQNLIVCEKSRPAGETARGIQLGDGAPPSICDGDGDQDGQGDCVENGQSQEAIVRNNIIMNCNNGGSATGIMVGSDRGSRIIHNTVYQVSPRNGGFYVGHPVHETQWHANIMENGINTRYAERALNVTHQAEPSLEEMNAMFRSPSSGDFSLVDGVEISNLAPRDPDSPHDFCGYPRGETTDLGALDYSAEQAGLPCPAIVQEMFDRIPN